MMSPILMVAPLLLVNATLFGSPIEAQFVADKDCGTSMVLALDTVVSGASVVGTVGYTAGLFLLPDGVEVVPVA